jgi:hypothetical protein
MATTKRCDACLGTGEVIVPDIRDKITNHLIHAAVTHPGQRMGLGLSPEEVAELADALEIPLPEIPDAGPV